MRKNSPSLGEERKLQKRNFIYIKIKNTMKNNKKTMIIHCIQDLKKAYKANIVAHNYRDYCNNNWASEDVSFEVNQRDKHYYLKVKYLKKAIEKIKKFKLPIKYWTNKWITYFEYDGIQVSFHTFSSIDDIWGKKFKWEWNWKINSEFPFENYV